MIVNLLYIRYMSSQIYVPKGVHLVHALFCIVVVRWQPFLAKRLRSKPLAPDQTPDYNSADKATRTNMGYSITRIL